MRIFVIPLCIGLGALVLAGRAHETSATAEVTYNKDVAPILQKNCIVCHRPNDIAPMSLMTYDEVLPFARLIRENVVQRKMPPWHADPAFSEFNNDGSAGAGIFPKSLFHPKCELKTRRNSIGENCNPNDWSDDRRLHLVPPL